MKKQSNSLFMRAVAILSLLLAMVFVMTSCPNILTPQDTPTSGPETIPEGPETGLYYYDNNGTEYTLKLHSGNKFELFNGATKAGTYTVNADGTMSFTFAEAADGTATANIENGIITFTYQNSETRFFLKVDYTVAFSTDGGTEIASITVVNGKYATNPANPEKENHVFIGWYADAEYKTPFVFNATPITANTTLYARWAYKAPDTPEYTVSFVGADVEDMITIGGKLYGVPSPKKDGYIFGGWWTSMSANGEELTAKYEEDDSFTANTTLYALWIPDNNKAPVVEVTVDGLTWNAVSGAIHYPVKITDPSGAVVYEENVTGTALNYSFTTAGKYKIEVSAYIDGATTETAVRYFIANGLDRVDGLRIEDFSIFAFNPVPNAEKYILTIVCGNPDHKHDALDIGNATTYNFAGCDMAESGITFTVVAKAYGYADSVPSETITCKRNLDAVTNLTVSDDIVSWAAVENATGYEVKVTVDGFTLIERTQDTCSLNLKYYSNGAFSVSVKAVSRDYISAPASTYSYNKVTLAAPANLTVSSDVLSWDAVAGENVSYIIYINGVEYTSNTNSFNFTEASLSAQAGDVLKISIISTNGTSLSALSDEITVNYGVFSGPIAYNNGTLSWSAVLGFSGKYEVKVGSNEIFNVSTTSTPITFAENGKVTVAVRFVGTNSSYTSQWEEIVLDVYAITFDTRMGSGVGKLYFAAGDYVTLPTNTTRTGYTFNNWYNSSDVNSKLVTDGVFEAADVILYAHWKANTYKVIYTVDETVDGAVNGSINNVVYDSTYQLATPTSDAGAFIGWYTGPNGSGLQLTDDSGKSKGNWTIAEDTKVYPAFAEGVLDFILRTDGTYGVKSGPAVDIVSHIVVPQTYKGKPVTAILEDAFPKNGTMKSISIPNTIEIIGVGAFDTAYVLENIEIREIEGTINLIYSSYDGALIKNDLGTIYLEFVPRMKAGTFTVPEGVSSIRNKAFLDTPLIEKVIISKDVTMVAEQAFFKCTRLTEIEFIGGGEKGLTIANGAFANTPALKTIKFPARLTSISISTLDSVTTLKEIFVEDDGKNYGSTNGILTNGAKDTLLYAPTLWEGDLVIPVGVTAIGENAFANREGITSVTIPSWVTTIGKKAFANTANLTSVTFEGGKYEDLTIGEYAFANCNALTTLVINGGSSMDDGALIIGAYAFANNAKLTTPIVAENANITAIGAYAFSGCSAISEVVIQKTTATIGEKAYAQCSNIGSVTFAEGADTAFGSFVFEGCEKLTSINLPSTIAVFDGSVFAGCNNITAINVATGNPALSSVDGILYDGAQTTVLYCPRVKVVDMTTLPATVTKIGTAAFQSNASIVELVLPASITEIGEMAFESCTKLTSVTFAEGTTSLVIGDSAFANCVALTTVTLPNGLTNIGEKAFYLTKIASLTLPETVTTIGAYAFAKTNIAALTIPGSVTTIAEAAFNGCTKLKTVTFAEGGTSNLQLGSLEDEAGVFEGSTAITTVTLPKRIQIIGSRAFYNVKTITTMTIPDNASLEKIGNMAFYYNNKVTKINLPEGLTYIGEKAFYYWQATNFKTLTIPSTVTYIGPSAFYSCNKLTTVTFTDGGTEPLELSEKIFYGCTALTTVTFPSNLDVAYQTITTAGGLQLTNFSTIFGSCSKLQYIYVSDDCEKYADLNGIFCEKDATGDITRVIFCPAAYPNATVTIPSTVVKVDNNAFNFGTSTTAKVTTIVFEDTPNWDGTPTLVLGDGYYTGFDSKEDVKYPVFMGTKIKSIVLPKQLKSIGCVTFYKLTYALQGSTSPYDVTETLSLSFNPNSAPINIVGQYAISSTTAQTLELPKIASLSKYAITANWVTVGTGAKAKQVGLTSLTFASDSTLEEIPANAIYNNKGLTSFNVPASVKKIGANAFTGSGTYSENALSSITFEEGSQLQYIGDNAFANISLTSFAFPETVTTIGKDILLNCDALTTLTLNSKMKNLLATDGTSIVSSLDKLKTIIIPENNPYLAVDNEGVLYSADGKQLLYCPSALEITGTYVVPNTVTSIEDDALVEFGKYGAETTIVLPEGLLRIGENALTDAYITSINIPSTVQEIGANAFASISGLTTVTFANNSVLAYIGEGAFSGCDGLTAIDIPDSVTELGTGVFTNCYALVTVDLPAALTALPANTFSGCKALKTVNMKEGLESIAGGAFNGCSALETVTFPASFKFTTGTGVFANCSNLTTVVFPENTQVSDLSAGFFVNCPKLTTFTFPATIVVLKSGVFSNCPNIESIVIEGPVTSIPDGIFKGFTNLTSITIPATVTEIGANAFAGCTGLKNITIPEGVTKIAASAFEGCTGLKTITLPESLTEIGAAAFRGCTALTGIVIGKNVTAIGNYAFEDCTDLASVEFASGNAIEKLGSAFDVESAIFRNTTALKNIVLPDTVKVIGAYLFENSGIESIQLPKSLTAISEYAFAGCASLKTLTTPDAVVTIYDYAFLDCTSLTSVKFGSSVASFGTAIFMNCTALKSVSIPASVTSMAGNPFINCPALEVIDIDANNPKFKFMNGMIFDADVVTLIYYSPLLTDATPTLPDTVCIFAPGAFYGSQIQSFEVPATMTTISDMMFMDCKSLTSIDLPNNITKIGNKAFMGSALVAIEIPETVTQIGEYAFANCTALTTVEFAERKTPYTFGAHAFDGATSLTEIELDEHITGLAPYMFANTGMVTYTIPEFITNVNVEGVFANNKNLTNVTMHNNVGDTLGVKFFMNCTAMTSYTMPTSIVKLGELIPTGYDGNGDGILDPARNEVYGFDTSSPSYAFAGCTALESIVLNNVVFIGAGAFKDCTKLTSVKFGTYLATIGDYAFANCTSIATINLNVSLWTNSNMYRATYIDIGRFAFANCTALTTVTFKNNSAWGTLYDGAFENCTSIPSLTWDSSKYAQIGPMTEGDPFRGWTETQKYTVK